MSTFKPEVKNTVSAATHLNSEVYGYLNVLLHKGGNEHHLGGLKLESKRLHRSEPKRIWELLLKLQDKGLLKEHVHCKIIGIDIPLIEKEETLSPEQEAELDKLLNIKEGVKLLAYEGGREYSHPPFAWIRVEVSMPQLIKNWSIKCSSLVTTGDSRALMSCVLGLHDKGVGDASLAADTVYDLNGEEELELDEALMSELGLGGEL